MAPPWRPHVHNTLRMSDYFDDRDGPLAGRAPDYIDSVDNWVEQNAGASVANGVLTTQPGAVAKMDVNKSPHTIMVSIISCTSGSNASIYADAVSGTTNNPNSNRLIYDCTTHKFYLNVRNAGTNLNHLAFSKRSYPLPVTAEWVRHHGNNPNQATLMQLWVGPNEIVEWEDPGPGIVLLNNDTMIQHVDPTPNKPNSAFFCLGGGGVTEWGEVHAFSRADIATMTPPPGGYPQVVGNSGGLFLDPAFEIRPDLPMTGLAHGVPRPPSGHFILNTPGYEGTWQPTGVWVDTDVWRDAA